jgi:hypothetical protein
MAVGVGDTLYGFCNGYFGRDSYGDKRVVAVGKEKGTRWVLAWDRWDNCLKLAQGFSKEDLEKWAKEEEVDEEVDYG